MREICLSISFPIIPSTARCRYRVSRLHYVTSAACRAKATSAMLTSGLMPVSHSPTFSSTASAWHADHPPLLFPRRAPPPPAGARAAAKISRCLKVAARFLGMMPLMAYERFSDAHPSKLHHFTYRFGMALPAYLIATPTAMTTMRA